LLESPSVEISIIANPTANPEHLETILFKILFPAAFQSSYAFQPKRICTAWLCSQEGGSGVARPSGRMFLATCQLLEH
jgi:hypothetical protein